MTKALDFVTGEKIYTETQIEELLDAIENNILPIQEPLEFTAYNTTKTSVVSIVPIFPIWKYIRDFIYNIQYMNRTHFGYDIFNDFHLDTVNYNVYEEGGEYEWHRDGNSFDVKWDIKLTAILNLSLDEYEGGALKLGLTDQKELDRFNTTPGSMIVFNPFTTHKVEPVTKGIRRSLSYWVGGPKWK